MGKTRKDKKYDLDFEDESYEVTSGADPIRHYGRLPKSEQSPGYDGPGWYFWTYDWSELKGPFDNLVKCQNALTDYRKSNDS